MQDIFFGKNISLTHKQIQKLVYYAYAWYIVKNNNSSDNIQNRLFEQRPEAWIHGPVFKYLYDKMHDDRNMFLENLNDIELQDDERQFLDVIYNVYGKYTGNQLEDLTHAERPWIEGRDGVNENDIVGKVIRDETIYNYYNN